MDEMNEEIAKRIDAMPEDLKEHLKHIIYNLIRCYGDDNDEKAIVIFGDADSMRDVVSVNCNKMEVSNLLLAVNEVFEYLNTKDAPPKEMFN